MITHYQTQIDKWRKNDYPLPNTKSQVKKENILVEGSFEAH
jgi:hypothetical protein